MESNLINIQELDRRLSRKITDAKLRVAMMTLDDRYYRSLDIMSPFPFKDPFVDRSERAKFLNRHNIKMERDKGIPVFSGDKLISIFMAELGISRELAYTYENICRKYLMEIGQLRNEHGQLVRPD